MYLIDKKFLYALKYIKSPKNKKLKSKSTIIVYIHFPLISKHKLILPNIIENNNTATKFQNMDTYQPNIYDLIQVYSILV